MKRTILFTLLLILGISLCSNVYAQIDVTIGDGTTANTTTGTPTPYGTFYKNFRQQYLILASEIEAQSGGAGNINSLAFNVQAVNTCSPMPNFTIRLKHTSQTVLSTTFEVGDYQTVFVQNDFLPVEGWNTHPFTAPFVWDGTSNILVDVMTSLIPGAYTQNASVFYTATGFNSSLRYQSDTVEANTATTGSLSMNRSNIRFNMQSLVLPPNDLQAVSLSGSNTPTAGMATNYTVTVRNRGSVAQTTYQVKLYRGANIEVGSVAGTAIQPNASLTFTIPWTPAAEGPEVLYGKVILAGDVNPANDQTPPLNVTVQPAGVQSVTIGDGGTQARSPMDFFWLNSLFETLYYPDELGFASGTITALQFYNDFTEAPANGNTKIWLGSTNQADLSAGWIPSTQLTLVFDGVVDYPVGINTINIPLQTPYMHTPGNLVMMVNRPMDTGYYDSTDYFDCQTVGTNRSLKVQADGTLFDPAAPPAATATGVFPKTTIFYSGQAIVNDMGALSISGNPTPSVGSATPYTIRVKNNGTAVQSNYQVQLFKEGDVMVGSVNGTTINSLQTLDFTIPWTPAVTGPTFLYGRVVLAADEIAQNNQTTNLSVNVQPAGIVAVTVGAGGSTGLMPVNMYYGNSLFETVYLGSEMNIGGLLTAVQFYNNFTDNLPGMPTNIWMGETTQTDLSAGWIPSTELTQVFAGTVDYPSGANNILVTLTTPYVYGGGNLVVMVQRPMDPEGYYSSSDRFVTQTGDVASRTLLVQSDGTAFDPAAPPAGTTPQAMFPMTTFMLITEGMGSISGTVNVGTTPLAGATVTVVGTALSYTTSATGTYSFPYVAEGAHQVNATKHGYTSVTQTVTVVEDQNVVQNFTLALLPQVTVSGRIVGSDQPTVGLAGATMTLSGYEPYTATTNATGNFTIPNVYASQTYNYTATAIGYQTANGQVVVGTTNVNMGDVTVNEMSYPPSGVTAVVNPAGTQVALTWQVPSPAETGWIHYDSGENNDSIGTGGVADFDVAIRYPASALTPYIGASLQALKVWPAQPGEFSLRVWTGGDATAPGNMLVDQAFTPVLDQYNTVNLTTPVSISGSEELWFGYRCNVTSGYPAGCDAGPATEGLGNMMYYQGAWTTLTALNPDLNYNWNIQGYVGFAPPAGAPVKLTPLAFNADRYNTGTLTTSGVKKTSVAFSSSNNDPERILMGYRVYRLLAANQGNEATWTTLTPTNIAPTNYTDTAWAPLAPGVYKYAVKAAYSNGVLSIPAFSNALDKDMMGTLTGTVTDFGTGAPIAGAVVTAGTYTGTTNAAGLYSFGVYQNTYTVTCAKAGYQLYSQPNVVITGLQTTTLNIQMMEIAFPAYNVIATEAADYSNVVVTWSEPGTAETGWLHYDSGENNDSIGTGGTADFDVAIRYPASALTMYAGASLQALKVWPAQAGTFSLRVWTGGDATAPANMVVDQAFTPVLDQYNTVNLNTPVQITGSEELWFGYRCNVTSGYPAGCDAGPATDGFGNMMYYQGAWTTLTALNPDLNYNWNIQGFAGFAPPAGAPVKLTPLAFNADRYNTGTLTTSGVKKANVTLSSSSADGPDRSLVGYKVWRLLAANQNDEGLWTLLTPTTITALTLTDNAWQPLPSGVYKFAVKAVYTNNVLANASFSNEVHKGMMGVLTGTITDFGTGAPVAGATVTAGTYTGTSNAAGVYSFQVYQGVYTVMATKLGYQAFSQANVSITGLQTTTLNIQMVEIAFPPYNVVATEAANFSNVVVTWSAPDPNAAPVEDFESGDFTSFPWVMGGVAPWTIDTTTAHGGVNSARSGVITHSQATSMEVSRNVIIAGNLSFWYSVSSESSFDFLKFYIDGVQQGSWSGTIDWTQASYPLTVGTHVLKWEYSKDSSVNSGSDCAWVDDIEFPASTDAAKAGKKLLTETQTTENTDMDRSLVGYKVWRLLAANQGNEATWTSLTPTPITAVTYTDNTWQPLPSGVYKFAVKAVYTNNVLSVPAFSNEVHKGMMGVLTGTVTDFGTNAPIAGALITAGTYTGTTNATGAYSFGVYQGTYTVTCTKAGYQPFSQANVSITGLQTTTLNIQMVEIAYPPYNVVATEAVDFSNVVVNWLAPDPNAEPVETFETGNFNAFPWVMGGTAPWIVASGTAHGGTYAAQSGDIDASQNSTIETTRNVIMAGNVGFWYSVSSESGWDFLKFYIDGVQQGSWSGTIGWTQATYPLGLGTHVLKWEYSKDGSVDSGSDCAWIDDITFPASTGPVAYELSRLFNTASQNEVSNPKNSTNLSASNSNEPSRALVGYKVWRLLAANEGNEATWTSMTPNPITALTYTDNTWQPLPSGVYKFAIKAVYTNNVLSNPALSNAIHKGMMGVLTGTVTEFGTNVPLEGATITAGEYNGTTNASGVYSFSVYQNTYEVTCAKVGYQTATQAGVNITGLQTTTLNFVLTELTLPPAAVQATEASPSTVNIVWMAPGTAGGEWLHYDSGENNDSIGTGGTADFDVAIRFPASALQDYVGMSLHAVKVWPAQAGTFSLRVWTGGTPTAPGTQVVDQAFTPELDVYNTVSLATPVAVTGTEELWFGYRCNVTSGYPAGCDAGPATDGFGNMMYYQGAWTTLTALNPDLNYNWNIQGYVGYSAPTTAAEITDPIARMTPNDQYGNRTLTGYKVWRLLQGQENNETAWNLLTVNPISATGWQDTGWGGVPDGMYRWSVKAVYTGGALSLPAFSNELPKLTQIGTIAGIVRNMANAPIMGATVTSGTSSATTNASGAYSMQIGSGTHSVTASHPNYASVTQNGVIVVTGQTTTVNFQLPAAVILMEDGFEPYTDFAITFAPWTTVDVDGSTTYTMTGTTWLNSGTAQAFIIFNPTTTTPPATTITAHGGVKMAACVAATTPPNNDWLITPQLTGSSRSIHFWAKSLTASYGLERFFVGVSTTGTAPENFTVISGANYIQAPIDWTEYTYSLANFYGPIYVGIHCVSNDAWIFFVDDVTVTGTVGSDDPNAPVLTTELHNNYPNPFNPETTISYSVKEAGPVSVQIFNVKGQLVKTLVNGVQEAGNHTIVWNGKDNNGRAASSGVYFYKMNAGKFSSTKKMIMMK